MISYIKIQVEIWYSSWWPFCPGLNELIIEASKLFITKVKIYASCDHNEILSVVTHDIQNITA